jgi:hypothetical protein
MADPTQITLGHIGDLVFGRELKTKLKDNGVDNIRAVYELSSPTTQCANVTTIKNPHGKPCYICGLLIDSTNSETGLTGECEHILGIAQTIIFLGLYWAKAEKAEKDGVPFVPQKRALELEYGWSHRTCNQVKSDTSFITYDATTRNFIVNARAVNAYLNELYRNTRSNSNNFNRLLRSTYRTPELFVSARTAPFSDKFQQICNFLNGYGSPGLLNLLGAARVMEGPMHPAARELLSTEERVNNSKMRALSNVAGAFMALNDIEKQLPVLIASSMRPRIEPLIKSTIDSLTPNYANIIKSTPANMKKFAIPYVKISVLDNVSKTLGAMGATDRQTGQAIKRIGELITNLSSIPPDAMEVLNGIAASSGIAPVTSGGKRRKSIKRRHRKSKTLKRK